MKRLLHSIAPALLGLLLGATGVMLWLEKFMSNEYDDESPPTNNTP